MARSGTHEGPGPRRREPRLAVDLPATLGRRSPRPVRVLDLSVVGCLVRSAAPLVDGALVDLELELPDGTLRTKARVAETSLDGDAPAGARQLLAGLEFFGLAAADVVRLRRLVAAATTRRRGAHTAPP